jgi:serpin B
MKIFKFTLHLFCLFVFACQSASQKSDNQADSLEPNAKKSDSIPVISKFENAKLTEKAKQLALSNNQFGFDFYKILAKSNPNSQNICFSPLSLHTALGMLLQGTSGQTQAEIKQKLYLTNFENSAQDYFNLLGHLYGQNNDKTQVNIANSIWVQKELKVENSYINSLKKHFETEPYLVDFQDIKTVEKVNNWVKKETRNTIKEIIEEFKKETRLALMNALYFKAAWNEQFMENLTKEEDFHLFDSKKVKVNMMQKDGHHLFYEDNQLKIIELDYENNDFSMCFLLPKAVNGIFQLEQNINQTQLDILLKKAKVEDLETVKIPRFEFSFFIPADSILQKMNLQSMYDFRNELNPIADNLAVSSVKQKTFIKINESGTEASAATVIELKEEAPNKVKPKDFIADRPFLFIIRDKKSGAILFLGRVMNPNKKE